MMCVRCGLQKSGKNDFFVCDDCIDFSKIVKEIYAEIDNKMTNSDVIDPHTDKLFMLIADASFITAKNPQTSIFYKMCEFIIKKAHINQNEITEEELNRSIKTTKGWGDAFKIFEELNLIKVRVEKYQRVIELTEKTQKLAKQFDDTDPLSNKILTRLAHLYAGYVLLYILNNVSNLNEDLEDDIFIPYNQKPKTLWNVVMYLWKTAYSGQDEFAGEDLEKFISKRRIPSTTRGQIITALQSMSGTTVQGLIKDIRLNENKPVFKFEDYVMVELKRVRDQRERTR